MNLFFIFTVIIIGLSGITAQVLILRELLVSFFGNELTLGIILANWLASEALGVFIIGKFIERIKNKIVLFISLELIFAVTFPLLIYLSRTYKFILGVPFGEGIGLTAIFSSSFLIILPLGFCHGGLFSALCEIYSQDKRESASSIGHVYTWETIGTILGGIILTYIFLPGLNSFQTVFIVSIVNIIICLFFLKSLTSIRIKYTLFSVIVLSSLVLISANPKYLHRDSIKKQYPIGEVLDYRNSVYGNIVVTQQDLQRTFFYNGIPVITTPYPDITFVEEFGNLAVLFHPAPFDCLIISAGAGGIINELLKYPVKKIDYAELDPALIRVIKDCPTQLTLEELRDNRVNVINTDGRFFIRNTANKYDVIMLGISNPMDLTTNRLFTEEFFSMVKKRLNDQGILTIWLPGSLTYLSSTLRDVNFSIINAIEKSYAYLRIIPGDYNLVFASDSEKVLEVSPKLLIQRIARDNIKTKILNESYLNYRMDQRWLDWFHQSTVKATSKINKDFYPFTLFLTLVLWNQQFSPKTAYIFEALRNLNLLMVFGVIAMITLAIFYFVYLRRLSIQKFALAYAIASTGFFGMLINLVLIFSFQIFYGYLYNKIGLLIAIFMAGTAMGSAIMTKNMELKDCGLRLLIKLEVWIMVFCCFAAFILTQWMSRLDYGLLIFICLFFISGAFVGFEFPLTSKLFLKDKTVGTTAGILYFSDLLGGWLAGIVGGIIFLPLLGLFNSCVLIILLKILSLLMLEFSLLRPQTK
jgi:spermidine synthase